VNWPLRLIIAWGVVVALFLVLNLLYVRSLRAEYPRVYAAIGSPPLLGYLTIFALGHAEPFWRHVFLAQHAQGLPPAAHALRGALAFLLAAHVPLFIAMLAALVW
jgi:hypothetical protein